MPINDGDFVRLNFTGKIKKNNEIFDTTYEDVAEENEFYPNNKIFKPIPVIIGEELISKKMEDEIIGLEEGDKKTIEVSVEEGFGKRSKDLIELIPMKKFEKAGINPVPGLPVSIGGRDGKILTINSGRVKVDFNHELAGKDLIYDVEITEIVDNDEDKIKCIIELMYNSPRLDIEKTKVEIDGDTVNITLNEATKMEDKPYIDVTFERYVISQKIAANLNYTKFNFIDTIEIEADDEEE